MNEERKLANFHVPNDLCDAFDGICRARGKTRTSVLRELMMDYVLQNGPQIVKENAFITKLAEANPVQKEDSYRAEMITGRSDREPLTFYRTDGADEPL